MNPEVWMDFTETDGQSWQPREYSQAFKDAMSEDFPDMEAQTVVECLCRAPAGGMYPPAKI